MHSIAGINRSERKLIKKLATIDGTNYWDYHWNADKTEHSHKLVARISEHSVQEEDAHNQRKFAYMQIFSFSLHTMAIIIGLILGYIYLGSIIGAMLGFVLFWTIIRYCVFSPP